MRGAATCGATRAGAAICGAGAAGRATGAAGRATGAAGRAAGAALAGAPWPFCLSCAPAITGMAAASAAANTNIPVFVFIFRILHNVPAAGFTRSVFNWLNVGQFTDPAVDHADVIENEGLLSFHNRTLRLPQCARSNLSAGSARAAVTQPLKQFDGGVGIRRQSHLYLRLPCCVARAIADLAVDFADALIAIFDQQPLQFHYLRRGQRRDIRGGGMVDVRLAG